MKLSDNSIGNRLQLKLMDGNELLYADQKTVTSPSDTLFNFKHLVPNVKAWSAGDTLSLYNAGQCDG